MSNIGKFFWGLRCKYYSNKMMISVIFGDRKKANECFNKILDMMDAYRDVYL